MIDVVGTRAIEVKSSDLRGLLRGCGAVLLRCGVAVRSGAVVVERWLPMSSLLVPDSHGGGTDFDLKIQIKQFLTKTMILMFFNVFKVFEDL